MTGLRLVKYDDTWLKTWRGKYHLLTIVLSYLIKI